MVQIFKDIFYYLHPLDANCNVYAFTDGNDIDLIDSGVRNFRIVKWLWRNMKADGLDPHRIRSIIHPHYHLDHVQADSFFTEKCQYGKEIKIYLPENDLFRAQPGFNLVQWNLTSLLKRFKAEEIHHHFKNYERTIKIANNIFGNLINVVPPNEDSIKTFKTGDKITIGTRTADVYSTGGHTEGHSFLHFNDSSNILYTGDYDAMNEYSTEWGNILKANQIAVKLKPDNIFTGHNMHKLGHKKANNYLNSYFNSFESILKPMLSKFQKGMIINLSSLVRKMTGILGNLKAIDFWANMKVFAIGKHFEDLGLGKLLLDSDNTKKKPKFNFKLELLQDPNEVDIISILKNG